MSRSNLMQHAYSRGWCDGKAGRQANAKAYYSRPALIMEYSRGYERGQQQETFAPSLDRSTWRRWAKSAE